MLERSPRRPCRRSAPRESESSKTGVKDCLNSPLASVRAVRIADDESVGAVPDHIHGLHRMRSKLVRELSIERNERLPADAFSSHERDLSRRDSAEIETGQPFHLASIGGRILPTIPIEGIRSARIR